MRDACILDTSCLGFCLRIELLYVSKRLSVDLRPDIIVPQIKNVYEFIIHGSPKMYLYGPLYQMLLRSC